MIRSLSKPAFYALVALSVWALLPGTFIDRGLFWLTARSVTGAPFLVTGAGSHGSPYTLRFLKQQSASSSDLLPDILITDDPDRVFQSSPPSPVDFAVILKNLRRLGRDSVAIGMPLAWAQPDTISLMALDQQLDALSSVVTAAPLTRGTVPSPLPPAFRRASIALSDIQGDTGSLPLVNRVSIPDVVLGNMISLAGFTLLESEPVSARPHLLARWDDRAVLSFPLLAAIADQGFSPAKIKIRLGEFISLGSEGPFIPIDEFGRLALAPAPSANTSPIHAESLIDAPEDFLKTQPAGTVLIRNGISATDVPSLRFSESLPSTTALLANPSSSLKSTSFPRIPWPAELLLIASLICLLHGLNHFSKTNNLRTLLVLAGVFIALHFILLSTTSTWPPSLAALSVIFSAIAFSTHRLYNLGNTLKKTNKRRRTRNQLLSKETLTPSHPISEEIIEHISFEKISCNTQKSLPDQSPNSP